MSKAVHHGHVEFEGSELGATLTLEAGRVALQIASTTHARDMPERLEILCFRSNTGYFTLIDLLRLNHSVRLGVGGLSTFNARLAYESAHFQAAAEIRSGTWSMIVGDVAKIIHVNGVTQEIIMPESGGMIISYTVKSPPAVVLPCPSAKITLRLGQHIKMTGDLIRGPNISLTYPIDLVFDEEVDAATALRAMHRIGQALSLLMGRILPITKASIRMPTGSAPHEVTIHGLIQAAITETPVDPIVSGINPELLAQILDCWLSRYDELGDAIRLHMSGLEQRRLPSELKFQIFVQALEAFHRRISPTEVAAIDAGPIVEALRERAIPGDIVDRVTGILAHAHEPGLRQRLKYFWDRFEPEISTLRPGMKRKSFIGHVVSTRNHYAHRTDRDEQVLSDLDLMDATETIKAISHMTLLDEMGADTAGIGQRMLDRGFVGYVLRDLMGDSA